MRVYKKEVRDISREKEVLRLIEENPMISQNELSEILGITRSSTSVHITNLMKKGYIKGRGYIVDKNDYVCVVGGATSDLQGFPSGSFKLHDSNPGSIKISSGGVGRNISENLARLGARVKLITAIGDDLYGNKILQEADNVGIDMKDTFIIKGQSTSTYMSILDAQGDMAAAISDMKVFEAVTVDMVKDKKNVIENSKACILDTNLSEEILAYILNNHKNVDFFLDTVSTAKAMRVKEHIGQFHTVKLNRIEAEMLTGRRAENQEELIKASESLLAKGVRKVFITLGKDGVFYNDGRTQSLVGQPEVKVINATGAGDAFAAALVHAYLEEYDIDYTARFAIATAVLALSHENTINPYLNIQTAKKKMEELKLC